jgi:hypothetical protein
MFAASSIANTPAESPATSGSTGHRGHGHPFLANMKDHAFAVDIGDLEVA